jgi:hypothetical protein
MDPRPHLLAIMKHICQLVFLMKTPDPSYLQSCYVFVNMCYGNQHQTPFACNHITYLSTCVSEEDPRPQLLPIMLHICHHVFWKSTPDPICLQSCYIFVNLCFWRRPQTPVAYPKIIFFVNLCFWRRPQLLTKKLKNCELVFLKKTPDPSCFKSGYVFVNLCFWSWPQTPVASQK